jgi:glutamate dehydrogenase/leucine dehydrogenase
MIFLSYANFHPGGKVSEFRGVPPVSNEDLLEIPCDIPASCATAGQIKVENAPRIRCRILAEGANGPMTLEAEDILTEKGVFIIPDVLGNAGGVTASYFEWVEDTQKFFWNIDEVNRQLQRIMLEAFREVLHMASEKKVLHRMAALMIGISRVADAMRFRGLYPQGKRGPDSPWGTWSGRKDGSGGAGRAIRDPQAKSTAEACGGFPSVTLPRRLSIQPGGGDPR